MTKKELKLKDEVWFMEQNKPTCYFVYSIIETLSLIHKTEYGYMYDIKEISTYDYKIAISLEHDNPWKTLMLSDMDKEGVKWFRTKDELIKSL